MLWDFLPLRAVSGLRHVIESISVVTCSQKPPAAGSNITTHIRDWNHRMLNKLNMGTEVSVQTMWCVNFEIYELHARASVHHQLQNFTQKLMWNHTLSGGSIQLAHPLLSYLLPHL